MRLNPAMQLAIPSPSDIPARLPLKHTMFGTPAEAVTYDKRQRIRHLAARWIEDSRFRPAQIRFDVAAILDDELEVIEGAF